MGVDRLMLMVLCDAYEVEETADAKGEAASRVVMRFHPTDRAVHRSRCCRCRRRKS